LRLLLDLHRHLELLLRDEPVGDEEVAQVLAFGGGGGRRDAAVLKIDALFDSVAVDQRYLSSAEREPLQQLPSCIVLRFPVIPT
jgi:hypothetical protein